MRDTNRSDFPVNHLKWNAVLFFCLFLGSSIFGQQVRFQHYSVTEGLCHPFVYNINQDKNGFLWIGTGEGLCRYDGLEFSSPRSADSLPVDVVNVSYTDNHGKIWFGFNNGEVWSYDGISFTQHLFAEDMNSSVTGISQSEEEGILIATQNKGLFHYSSAGKAVQFNPSFNEQLISALCISGRDMLVGTQEGLFRHKLGNNSGKIETFKELEYIKIQKITPAYNGNSFWIGTEDEGLYFLELLDNTSFLSKVGVDFNLGYENIQDIVFDNDSNLILCSFNSGVISLKFKSGRQHEIASVQRVNAGNGLNSNFIKCAYIDHEGNTWLGTYGSGVSMQANQFFRFFDLKDRGIGNSVYSITMNDSLIWMGGENGILRVNKETSRFKLLRGAGLPNDIITSMYYNRGTLWVGTSANGIYSITEGSRQFTPFFRGDNSISNSINYLIGDGDFIYAATKNGIYVINIASKDLTHYSTINGLPHNDIEHLYLDSENRLLFATRTNGIYEINVRGEVLEYFTVGKYELAFNSITQDKSGNLWVSTYGQGVFLLLTDSIINITDRDGLKTDYCYSIVSDDSMYVWVGHRLGFSRIDVNTLAVSVFDSDNGITGDCNQNAVCKCSKDLLYFGTTDGVVSYDIASGYQERKEPRTNILRVFISDKEYDFHTPIVLPYSAYKLRIEYIGLNFSDPRAVRYQYMLEGHDLDWSEITDSRVALYPRIEDGEYTFLLKAIGPDGTVNQVPVQFSIKVKLPVWKTWWFITLLALLILLLVIVIIKYRERKQKEIQEYLEQRLDERTREVVEQKEEIELKNRDITDSINYAQRIQSSILPPIKRLQSFFDGSFVFYQPRDIVSGDFYWFDKVKENKFIIVCADSTGHGVPGAFMSMIGTTLIKDVCSRPDVNSPSEVLRELDVELRNMLNQNIDVEKSNDGMDMMVCEIDTRTNYLRYASALRPMIVYRGADQIYVKGSRSSVGGQYDKDEKIFKDEGIQLDKGDLIYMFSDGYPDQFGGSVGKKFKMVRLKNLLKDIHQKPMEEQYEYVKSTFNLWREDFDQVDDVLFMGIKL